MTEDHLYQVSALLEEVVGSEGGRKPSDAKVCATIWEACGASGALQILADLLNTKVMDLEEGTGSEESDAELLQRKVKFEQTMDLYLILLVFDVQYDKWLGFDSNPLYALLHEVIYCQGDSSRWSAHRIKSENDNEFDAIKAVKEGRPVLFTVEIASDGLKHRVVEVSLADLQKDEDQAFRKIRLRVEDVQGNNVLTNFWGMDFTTDKLRSLVRKWQTLIEAHVDVKTTDNFTLMMFCIGFTKKRANQQKRTCYAQSSQIRQVIFTEEHLKHHPLDFQRFDSSGVGNGTGGGMRFQS